MINLNRLKKADILWLHNHYCRHNHRYTEHISCYETEKPTYSPIKERVGFFDIEASNLSGDFGFIFSYVIKPLDEKPIARALTPKDIRSYVFDKNLMKQFTQDIRRFDRVVVYWGKPRRFDCPFVRTRCLKWGLDFPLYKEIYVTDCYDMVRGNLRLHRNRLETACQFLNIPSKAHRLAPEIWQRACAGDKKSLNWILKHNIEDCESLEALWKKLQNYSRIPKTSM